MANSALLLLLAAAASGTSSQETAASAFGPVGSINQSDLRAHLEFIASDELEGRYTPSRGLDIAARYIAAQLALYGAKPGGVKGTYFQAFPMPDGSPGMAANVIGIFEGTDPVLKNEYVAVGCHYDHIGVGGSGPDRIFNGADDNGSGTAAMLEMAQALSRQRPKRSVLLIWHAGEERGLWGSDFYVKSPTVPIKSITAMLNIDMIGRSWNPEMGGEFREAVSGPNEIFVIGSKKMSDSLGQLSERVNRQHLRLGFNYKFDDPADPEGLFYRSDHYNYAKAGIPIIFYFDGIHPDYHQVTDEVSRIDFTKLVRVSQTIFATAWTLANEKSRPAVNRPLAQG